MQRAFREPEAWVLADGDKLKQVFWNFCENAVRAMQKTGGKLTVTVSRRDAEWDIDFSDTGPGMPPQPDREDLRALPIEL